MAESVKFGCQETVECDNCEGTDNVYHYCIQCPGNICDKCKLTHCNTRLTRHHRILPRTHPEVQQSRLSTKVYCKHHQDKEYVTFCTKCKIPCCPICISNDHGGHTFSDIDDEIATAVKEMNEITSNHGNSDIRYAEITIGTMTDTITYYKNTADKVKKSAEARIQQLHKDVDSSAREFMDALERQINTGLQRMDVKLKKINESITEMKKTADICRTTPADASLLMKWNEAKSMIKMNTRSMPYPGYLTFNESTSCITRNMIGQFKVSYL